MQQFSGVANFSSLTILLWGLASFRNLRNQTVYIAVSLLIEGLIRDLVRDMAWRMRPSQFHFAFCPETGGMFRSFPSGHTANVFTLSVFFFLLLRSTKYCWIGYVALLLSFLVAISRVYVGDHYPTDVLAGACFGSIWACGSYLIGRKYNWLQLLNFSK
jgi:membrane-associated phospholipid phosphatase